MEIIHYLLPLLNLEIKLLKVPRISMDGISYAPYGLNESFTMLPCAVITRKLSLGIKYDRGINPSDTDFPSISTRYDL